MVVAGAVPLVSRWYAERQRQTELERQREAVQTETSVQKAELTASKPRLLAELGALQAAGEHEKVLALAGRYRLADDKDIRAIYARSAAQVGFRQTIERMGALAQAQCTVSAAVESARSAFAEAFPEASVSAVGWSARKLDTTAFLPQIRERFRTLFGTAPRATDAARDRPGSLLDALRAEPPRLQPFIAYQLREIEDAMPPICVWQVNGTWAAAGQANTAKPFEMILWLAPSADEHTLTRDVLSLQGL